MVYMHEQTKLKFELYYLLKLKKIFIKLVTFWIFPQKVRKNTRNFLFYFSFTDYLKFKKQDFSIVSLGNNCLPRVLMTAIKLKPRKLYGEKSMPFDLKISPDLNRTIELIDNNFADFFENITLSKELFPHDYKLSKQEFRKRYDLRIKNFLEIMQSDKKIYFIYSDMDNNIKAESLYNLYDVLKRKRNKKPFKLIVIVRNPINIKDNPNIKIIVENFKIKDADWVESFINDYGDINNYYTEFCNNIKNKIISLIN